EVEAVIVETESDQPRIVEGALDQPAVAGGEFCTVLGDELLLVASVDLLAEAVLLFAGEVGASVDRLEVGDEPAEVAAEEEVVAPLRARGEAAGGVVAIQLAEV